MIRLLNIIVCGLTFAAYSASYLSPFTFWPFAFLGLLYPWLVLINVIFIIYWLLGTRKLIALFSILTLLAGWNHLGGLFGVHLGALGKDVHDGIRVLTYNVRRFQPYRSDIVEMIEPAVWSESLKRHRPDILCVQEYDRSLSLEPAALCRKEGLIHQFRLKGEELGIFSRYPIVNATSRMFNNVYGYQYADILIEGKTIRVYNVHLQSNAITGIAARVAETGSLREKRTWRDIRGMLGRYRRAARVREEQAAEIAEQLRTSPYPVLLCGDLNDVPQSFVYNRISATLQDAFQEAGLGLGITYAGPIPGLRIDVILTDPSLEVQRCQIGETEFSDHRPIMAIIGLK